jgi:Ca-activated chloride channel family protein
VKLRGEIDGESMEVVAPIAAPDGASGPAERIWAASRIAELEASADPGAGKEIVALSKRHHVLSRHTALLVLENDRMFAEFGIERTSAPAAFVEPLPAAGGSAPRLSGSVGTVSSAAIVGRRSFSASAIDIDAVGIGGIAPSLLDRPSMNPIVPMRPGLPFGMVAGGGLPDLPAPAEAAAPRVPDVRITAAAAGASGGGAEGIARVVAGQRARLRSCYKRGLETNPDLAGRVVVRLVIGPDGWVKSATNAESMLADGAVVSCVVSAFRSLLFPLIDGSDVTVVVPVVLATIAGPRPKPRPDPPPIVSQVGDDAWTTLGEDLLETLRRAAGDEGATRRRHEALVLGLLGHGRFPEALSAARRFADLDPELPRALRLLAEAAAAAGEAGLARTALDAEVELVPRSADAHGRAARAFEAAGDEVRACAHWRSLAELRPGDETRAQALRCRARLGEREEVLREAASAPKPGKLVADLVSVLEAGPSPAYDAAAAGPGEMEVTVRCSAETTHCPDVVVVKPSGEVVSPWSPAAARSSARAVAFAGLPAGDYRTVLVGGSPDARGEVDVRARNTMRTFRFERGGSFPPGGSLRARTAAVTRVTEPFRW